MLSLHPYYAAYMEHLKNHGYTLNAANGLYIQSSGNESTPYTYYQMLNMIAQFANTQKVFQND